MSASTTDTRSALLTVREVAEDTRLNPQYLYRLIADGDLPAVRIGRAIRVRRVDLDRFIEERLEPQGDC